MRVKPGGKGNCAVVGCTNSTYRLNKWRQEMCLEHHMVNDKCTCKRPFKLFFPSRLRNGDKRTLWIQAMKRENTDKTKWDPTDSDRVCSDHFVDGQPTPSNPNPSIGNCCMSNAVRRNFSESICNIFQGYQLKLGNVQED